MDQQIRREKRKRNSGPDYKRIYKEIAQKFDIETTPHIESYFNKEEWTALDVIIVNNLLFKKHNKEQTDFNQQHKAYDLETIKAVLDYQEKHKLSNVQVANEFKLSRNTLATWRKKYLE